MLINIDLNMVLSDDALVERVQTLRRRYDAIRSREPVGLPEWTYRKVQKEIDAGNYGYEDDPMWSEPSEPEHTQEGECAAQGTARTA